MTTSGSTSVPSPADLARALGRLEPIDPLRAAAHLATPVQVMVGPHVTIDEGWVHWRDATAYLGAPAWPELAYAMTTLVVSAAQPCDMFLDLSAAPVTWLKLVRCGALVHLAGARELFDAQHVTFDPALRPEVAHAVATMVAAGQRLITGTLHVGGQGASVRADDRAAFVTRA